MLNSADCRSKTARALAGAPWRGGASRGKGLIRGHRAHYRRAYEISRYVFELRTAALSRRGQTRDCTMPLRLAFLWPGERRPRTSQMRTTANSDAIGNRSSAALLLAEKVSWVLRSLPYPRPSCTWD